MVLSDVENYTDLFNEKDADGNILPSVDIEELFKLSADRKGWEAYIQKHFIFLDDSSIGVLKKGKYEIKEKAVVKDVYFNRLPKVMETYF